MDPTTKSVEKKKKPGKNIIICCDGTGNEYNAYHNTNVVLVFEDIVRDGRQIAFYDPGVGTFDALGRTMGKKLGTALGLGFGWGLQQNIEDPYRYLMDHYHPGDDDTEPDRIFYLGFSRGACTAGPHQLADAATFGISEQHFFFDPDDPIDAAQEDRPERTHG